MKLRYALLALALGAALSLPALWVPMAIAKVKAQTAAHMAQLEAQ